jgi:transposase
MNRKYASDISRDQFETIRFLLESSRKRTKPRIVDLYEVFCAILYLLKTGCQWRLLPNDFPKWRTVHKYFQEWSRKNKTGEPSILEQVLKKIGWRGSYETGAERLHKLLYS